MHIPVLVTEVVSFLRPTDRLVIDGTLGHGWHTRAMRWWYQEHNGSPTMIWCDVDPAMLAIAQTNLVDIPWTWHNCSYGDMIAQMKSLNLVSDFFLIDIGINWYHVLDTQRGFSIHGDGPLDMRFAPDRLRAADLIMQSKPDDIARRLMDYGDIGPKAATIIGRCAKERAPQTTQEWKTILIDAGLGQRVFAQCFQALRIAVNDELRWLERFLRTVGEVIAPRWRLAIISFHSGEDRIIKQHFKTMIKEWWRQTCGKTINPSYQEIQKNRASRSARLRVIEKTS